MLVQIFLALYETRGFITVFCKAFFHKMFYFGRKKSVYVQGEMEVLNSLLLTHFLSGRKGLQIRR
jgi:hypothetical protein